MSTPSTEQVREAATRAHAPVVSEGGFDAWLAQREHNLRTGLNEVDRMRVEATRERDQFLAAIEAVREIHQPDGDMGPDAICVECTAEEPVSWPCYTIRAIQEKMP